MASLENTFLLVAPISIILALLLYFLIFTLRRQNVQAVERPIRQATLLHRILDISAMVFVISALISITITIVSRVVQSGHGPFSNMYEFALIFAWVIVIISLVFHWYYRIGALRNISLFVALAMLIFTRSQLSVPISLVPALQQSTLLTAHVASAVIAYSTLTIGFGAAVLFLIQNRLDLTWLPNKTVLDNISYRSVIVGFPFLTLLIILGALWADIAWGRYWDWDPKETASLVTWLIYAGYMHARVMRGWRENKTAVLLIIGFLAILLTFFGNYVFSGLHAYD